MNLRQFAHALGGEMSGQQVLCPGPGHSPRDRSLCVRLAQGAPDGFVVTSFAGDDPLNCKDYVRARLGLPAFERAPSFRTHVTGRERDRAGQRCFGTFGQGGAEKPPILAPHIVGEGAPSPTEGYSPKPAKTTPFDHFSGAMGGAETPPSEDTARIRRAIAIWEQGEDPRGTIVEAYLKSRALELPWEAANEAIRYHARCPWREEVGDVQTSPTTIFVSAMVAAMRSIETGEITAIHRTRLTADGRKVDRKMLGKVSGSAIMLCPYSAVGSSLAIGEGIETCLAAWTLGWSNVWAMGSVGSIASFPVITGLDTLVLLAETGDNGASAKAIDKVAARYHDAGRRIIVVQPNVEGDLNDAIREAA